MIDNSSQKPRRAFSVWWNDLERWVVPSNLLLRRVLPLGWTSARVGSLVSQVTARVKAKADAEYKMAGIKWYGEGVFHRETVLGKDMSATLVTPLVPNALIYNRLFAWKASFAVVPTTLADCFVSSEFPQFVPDISRLLPEYLYLFCIRESTIRAVTLASTGSSAVSRNRFKEDLFLNFEIPLPPLDEQQEIVELWRSTKNKITAKRERVDEMTARLPQIMYDALGSQSSVVAKAVGRSIAVQWEALDRWSFNYVSRASQGLLGFTNSKFPIEPLSTHLIGTINGYSIKPVSEPTPHKMLKLNALRPDGLDLTASKYIKISDKIAKRFSIHKGDLFICRSVGSYEHVAKCSLAPEDAPNYVFPDTMIRLRFKNTLLSEYAGEVVQSPMGRSYFQSNARTAVGMWKIGADDIAQFPIPVPPLTEQRRIMKLMADARAEIALESKSAETLANWLHSELESIFLGEKSLRNS